MISLNLFVKIIQDIQRQEEKDDKLTKLLVCPDCTGWINSAEDLISDLVELLQFELGDKYECVSWWLYDISDNNKFVYEDIDDTREVKYDLNDLKDLYYYIIKDFKNVKQSVIYKQDKNNKDNNKDNEQNIISLKEFFDKMFEDDNE